MSSFIVAGDELREVGPPPSPGALPTLKLVAPNATLHLRPPLQSKIANRKFRGAGASAYQFFPVLQEWAISLNMAVRALKEVGINCMGAGRDRLPPKGRLLIVSLLVWVVVTPPGRGQGPVNAADREKVSRLFDGDHTVDLLNCQIQPQKPFLDFAFRFDVGYIVSCPLGSFGGHESMMLAFTRVTPEGREPILLGETFSLPALPPEMQDTKNTAKLKQQTEVSGGFAVGEGQYNVEVLVIDQESRRTSRKAWSVHTALGHGQRGMEAPVPAHTVLPLGVRPRPFKLDTSGKGLRLTILLNAAPTNSREQKLRVWDRIFLLGSLSTLLDQIPCASVRVVALNLDQQREVFRQDQFEDGDFKKLADALRTLELGTVSYQVLQQWRGWLDMLVDFANQELVAPNPADAVVILGPYSRYNQPVPREMLKVRETPNPRFCYFEYLPGDLRHYPYPDTFHSLTRHLNGSVYQIQSATDLGHAIQKMLTQVRPSGPPPVNSRWPARPAPTQ